MSAASFAPNPLPQALPLAAPAPSNRMVATTMAVSLLVHAVLLAIPFIPKIVDKSPFKSPPLEIVLVNSKSSSKPVKADVLAQANLDGGGNVDAAKRAKTPLPVTPSASNNQLAAASEKIEELERRTQELMTQARSAAPVNSQPEKAPNDTPTPSAAELLQKSIEAIKLEAQIARDMEAYQQRPKRRFIGTRAQEYRFAQYVEDWRMKIERVGNLNYPDAARQQKLYGSLVLTVAIKADGTLENVEINRSSGKKVLDAAAIRIVNLAAPFSAFPANVRRDTDVLHITRTWTFTRGDVLEDSPGSF